jgi:hypothetical protein
MDEQDLRKQGYIRIDQFCRAMDTWARARQQELESDYDFAGAGVKSSGNIGRSSDWPSQRAACLTGLFTVVRRFVRRCVRFTKVTGADAIRGQQL